MMQGDLVQLDDEDLDGMSREQVAAVLGLSPGRVWQLEQQAIVKMRIGLMVFELLGRTRGESVLASLRAKPLEVWHRALMSARTTRRGPR